jgi:hypothetical protein
MIFNVHMNTPLSLKVSIYVYLSILYFIIIREYYNDLWAWDWSGKRFISETPFEKENAKNTLQIIKCLWEQNDSMDFRVPVDWKGKASISLLAVRLPSDNQKPDGFGYS